MATVNIRSRNNRDGVRPAITAAQQTAIQQAADDAERISIEGLEVLTQIWNQPGRGARRRRRRKSAWNNNPIVVRWFGSRKLTNRQIRRTRRRMERNRDEFRQTVRFAVIHHQSGGHSYRCDNETDAFCSPGTRIKLCPSWFGGRRRQRAKLIIHELDHKNGHVHHDQATDPDSARNLARDDPRSARRNPENYACFCDEYY